MSKLSALVLASSLLLLSPMSLATNLDNLEQTSDLEKYKLSALSICISQSFTHNLDDPSYVIMDSSNAASTIESMIASEQAYWSEGEQFQKIMKPYVEAPFHIQEKAHEPLLIASCMDFYKSPELDKFARRMLKLN